MDDEGYINLGSSHGCTRAAVDAGAKALVQIDSNTLSVNTDYYRIHISEVEAICEVDNPINEGFPARPLDDRDKLIATHIAERIANGSTIQLGAGGVSNAMGNYLTEHKDLGVHAETLMESLFPLMENGVINNKYKPLLRGITVAGFIGGNSRVQNYLHNNPSVLFKKLAWVNHPDVISQIPNMVSINACLAADLRGQVCSESLGMGNTGGLGGQLDFVEGARRAPSGQSFLAMHSSVVTRNGDNVSKITMGLPAGSVATSPANDVMNIVTEYGVAEIWCKSAKDRARSMIRIAHPDFRDELTFNAKKYGLI
jgi:4-hydroxybutyrate CoA-transferase